MTPAQGELFSGRRKRNAGAGTRMLRDPLFSREAERVIDRLARVGMRFTSDTLREWMTCTPTHANGYGAVMLAAVRSGRIVRVGYRQSEREEARARVVAEYVGSEWAQTREG